MIREYAYRTCRIDTCRATSLIVGESGFRKAQTVTAMWLSASLALFCFPSRLLCVSWQFLSHQLHPQNSASCYRQFTHARLHKANPEN